MLFSPYAPNVILAKARAMYGGALSGKDFSNLIHLRSVSEVAAYLKMNTSYARALSEINEATVNRGHLEQVLRREFYSNCLALSRYDKMIGTRISVYVLLRGEAEQIMNCLRLLRVGRASEFLFGIPIHFTSYTRLDLAAMGRSKTYADILGALKNTMYHDILEKYAPGKDGEFRLTEIETAIYTRLFEQMLDSARRYKGSVREELLALYGVLLDTKNCMRIIRMKKFFGQSEDTIRANLLPYGRVLSDKLMERMITAPDADTVVDLFFSTKIARRIPQKQRQFMFDMDYRALFHNARRYIHFSIHPPVVMLCYILLLDTELANIINVIEGISYGLSSEEIKSMLILVNE